MTSVEKAVEKCSEIAKYYVSPIRCFYFNPSRYSSGDELVKMVKWFQKYVHNRMYVTLLRAAAITGYEPVPRELLLDNAKRDGYSGRIIKLGRVSFYLIKQEEMTKGLRKRYKDFKEQMTEYFSKYYEFKERSQG